MKPPPDSERRLVARLQERDERAFNELLNQYGQPVFRLVFRMLGRREEAEDVVQDVFVQVFKNVGQFRGESQLGTWLYRVAVNTARNHLKYLARRKADVQEELEAVAEQRLASLDAAEPEQAAIGHQAESVVQRALLELDPEFREVLVLRDLEELSYQEIRTITGLPEGTVKSRLHRARALLKERVAAALSVKLS